MQSSITPAITRIGLLASLCLLFQLSHAQQKLTVPQIMQDTKWIGTSPSDPFYSKDGKYLFFQWNPGGAPADSLYYIPRQDLHPKKADHAMEMTATAQRRAAFN